MVFYTYDYEDYIRDERGTYLDLEEVAPGPLVSDTEGLIAALRNVDRDEPVYRERYAAFRERFCAYETGRGRRDRRGRAAVRSSRMSELRARDIFLVANNVEELGGVQRVAHSLATMFVDRGHRVTRRRRPARREAARLRRPALSLRRPQRRGAATGAAGAGSTRPGRPAGQARPVAPQASPQGRRRPAQRGVREGRRRRGDRDAGLLDAVGRSGGARPPERDRHEPRVLRRGRRLAPLCADPHPLPRRRPVPAADPA